MFINLLAELARNNIKQKTLAKNLRISEKTLINKLKGKTEFTLKEMLIIKHIFHNKELEYLFYNEKEKCSSYLRQNEKMGV